MQKIEHIGIAVADLDLSNRLFTQLLGEPPYKSEFVESENVETSFFRVGNNKIELICSSDQSNTINRFIAKRGEGIHHIAFAVTDIRHEMKRLKEAGFRLIHDEPFQGADNKWVCFIHPKSSNGVLIELCQDRNSP